MFKTWSTNSNATEFRGSHDSAKTLPAAFYRIFINSYGEPVARKLDERADQLTTFSTGPMQKVVAEVHQFWKNVEHYKKLKVTHKRGILLHGPAGCGKTSIVAYLIKDTVNRGGIAVKIDNLQQFSKSVPLIRQIEHGRPLLGILEDIEQFCQYDESELLEIMDGASTLGDHILFLATTNKLHKVPPRIRCRPSRIDTLLEIGYPDKLQRYEYLKFLMSGYEDAEKKAKAWAAKTEKFSLAQLKELVISVNIYEKSVTESIATLRQLTGTIDIKREDEDEDEDE